MQKIEEFVYDPTSGQKLIFNIGSYSLKKALSKQVTKIYLNTGIFTEFQRNISETVIKKSKAFKQVNFLRGFAKPTDCPKKVSLTSLGFLDQDVNMNEGDSHNNKTPIADENEETKDEIEPLLPPLVLSSSNSLGFYSEGEIDDPISKLS